MKIENAKTFSVWRRAQVDEVVLNLDGQKGKLQNFQPKSAAVHPGKKTNMGRRNHAGLARLFMTRDEQKLMKSHWRREAHFHPGRRAAYRQLPGLQGARTGSPRLPRSVCRWVGGSDPGLLRCVSAAPRSSVGEVNLSPDDGQELPDLQLCGRAGCSSTDRSFMGLWPQHGECQAQVNDEAQGAFLRKYRWWRA